MPEHERSFQLTARGFERFPEPKTFSDAIKFLRRHCRVAQIWMQDADKFKMTCKTTDLNEDIAKQEFVIEIPLSLPQAEQEKKIFEYALLVFKFWKEYEDSKG